MLNFPSKFVIPLLKYSIDQSPFIFQNPSSNLENLIKLCYSPVSFKNEESHFYLKSKIYDLI